MLWFILDKKITSRMFSNYYFIHHIRRHYEVYQDEIFTVDSWNNTGFNCMGPLMCGSFLLVSSIAWNDPWLTESADTERWQIQRDCGCRGLTVKLHVDFQLCRGSAPLTPALFKGQQYSGRNKWRVKFSSINNGIFCTLTLQTSSPYSLLNNVNM